MAFSFGTGRTYPELVQDYVDVCKDLMFSDPETILHTTACLKDNLERYARQNSPVYRAADAIKWTDRTTFDGKGWLIEGTDAQSMSTSGSSTGQKFGYWRWNPTFEFVEKICHYRMVLDEFGLAGSLKVLKLNPRGFYKEIVTGNRSETLPYVDSHGTDESTVYLAQKTQLYMQNRTRYFQELANFSIENAIDVILGSGDVIHSFVHAIKSQKFDRKICTLLSNTGEPIHRADVNFLLKNRNIDSFCDHMRCWDGGASFFTCREGRYHLLDNLSWCEEYEGKLLSTDYFSVPSPFIRYWNGDLARIGSDYQKCNCGRWYREFHLLESRQFSFEGHTSGEILEGVKSLNIKGVRYLRCDMRFVDVVSDFPLTELDQQRIKQKFPKLRFGFHVDS